MKTITQIVEDGAAEFGLALPSAAAEAFEKYYEVLEEQGRHINLTAIKKPEEVSRLHFLDSLALLKAADFKNARVIDIGSGAGFPGIPLKIAEPTIEMTLIDATNKRVQFINDICAALGMDAACICARAEESSHEPDMREQFDIATSRAVASLNILSELCLPFVRVGGLFLAMKSTEAQDEVEQALSAIETLGAHIENTTDYIIPGTETTHRIISIRKIVPTPQTYPRRYAKIKRAPL